MYASRALTTQMLGSLSNCSNSKIGRGFPGLLAFVGFDILKQYLLSDFGKYLIDRLFISEHLEADVKVSNIVSFNVNIFVLNKSFGGRHFKYFKTVLTSHAR